MVIAVDDVSIQACSKNCLSFLIHHTIKNSLESIELPFRQGTMVDAFLGASFRI